MSPADTDLINKRIVFFAYSRLYDLLLKTQKVTCLEKVRVINSHFDDTLRVVSDLVDENTVDVVIASGSNARLIKENFPYLPIVTLNVSGFDLLSACEKAKQYSSDIAIVTYKAGAKWAPKMQEYSGSLNLNLMNIQYYKMEELKSIMEYLKESGFNSVIGASIACDYAEQAGLYPVLVYSNDSINESIEQAINLYKSIRLEKKNNNYFRAIIDFTYSGIIAIDQDRRITICNPIAENILKVNKGDVINKIISDVLPSTRLDKVLETGTLETNKIQHIDKDTTINTNRVPISVDGDIVGAIATFHDIDDIQNVEQSIRKKIHYYKKGLHAKYTFENIKGNSVNIKNVLHLSDIYAKSDQTVLIYGETGTGKELFAHSIHNRSSRHDKPFVAINCAALPANLLESELFGYEGGAFTGAKKSGKPGLFELAHQGTILLDEISEMPLALQTRLLRVLQEKEILRIGGERIIPVDVRTIATTNDDLAVKVGNNEFREDLYYRLNVLNLSIPPLRERLEDIPLIIEEIVKKTSPALFNYYDKICSIICNNFHDYDWPGNIRQLENTVQRIFVIFEACDTNGAINNDLLERAIDIDLTQTTAPKKIMNDKLRLLHALEEVQWNRQKAADLLGISRTTLWRKIKQYDLEPRAVP